MTWDWTAVIEGLGLFGGVIATIISLWVRSTVDDSIDAAIAKIRKDEFEPLLEKVGTQHDELVKLTARCDQQATRQDVHDIALQIAEALGEMKAMRTGMTAIHEEQRRQGSSMARVNDFLLNGRATT